MNNINARKFYLLTVVSFTYIVDFSANVLWRFEKLIENGVNDEIDELDDVLVCVDAFDLTDDGEDFGDVFSFFLDKNSENILF